MLNGNLSTVRESLFRGLWWVIFIPTVTLFSINIVLLFGTSTHDNTISSFLRDIIFLIILVIIRKHSIPFKYSVFTGSLMAYLLASLVINRANYSVMLSTYSIVYIIPVFISGLLLGWQSMMLSSIAYGLIQIGIPLLIDGIIPASVIRSMGGVMIVFAVLSFMLMLIEQLYRNLDALVAERTHDLEERTHQLATSEASKQAFFGNAVHNMRTPLAGIRTGLELLPYAITATNDGDDPTLLVQVQSVIDHSIARLNLLTERMIDIGQMTAAHPIHIIPNPISLELILDHVQHVLPILSSRIQIVQKPQADIVCNVDASRIEQALAICCEMLLQAIPEQQDLFIDVDTIDTTISITLTTPYIHDPTLEMAYNVIHSDKRTGYESHERLGLLLTHSILTAHAGSLSMTYATNQPIKLTLTFAKVSIWQPSLF